MTAPREETITLTRPEGVSDVRWEVLQTMATKVVTGHMPWCDDHVPDAGSDEAGWCRTIIRAYCVEVEVSNGTTDGRTQVSMYAADGVDLESLSVPETRAIASALETAANAAMLGNSTNGMEQEASS